MAIQQAQIIVTGISPLLQNNPQTVDPFNHYAKAKKAITNKRTAKTDDEGRALLKQLGFPFKEN